MHNIFDRTIHLEATVNVYTTTSQYAPPYKYGALYEQLDGENTHTQPINRIIHWAKNKANDIMGDSTFGFSGMMRSNGAMIWSNTIMKHCIAIHESSGYSHTRYYLHHEAMLQCKSYHKQVCNEDGYVGSKVAIHRYTPSGSPPIRNLVIHPP